MSDEHDDHDCDDERPRGRQGLLRWLSLTSRTRCAAYRAPCPDAEVAVDIERDGRREIWIGTCTGTEEGTFTLRPWAQQNSSAFPGQTSTAAATSGRTLSIRSRPFAAHNARDSPR